MGNYGKLFKMSAVSGAGFLFGIIPQLIVGMCILIAGIYLMKSDKKKNKDNPSIKYYIGILLIIIGSVMSLSIAFGSEMILSELL